MHGMTLSAHSLQVVSLVWSMGMGVYAGLCADVRNRFPWGCKGEGACAVVPRSAAASTAGVSANSPVNDWPRMDTLRLGRSCGIAAVRSRMPAGLATTQTHIAFQDL